MSIPNLIYQKKLIFKTGSMEQIYKGMDALV